MSTPVEWLRWPKLGIRRHPQLDWIVTEYEADKIQQMADAAEKGDWNPWTKATVELLRALADSPTALAALNYHRPTIPREVLGLNRAVHYLVRLDTEGDGKAETRQKIGRNWGGASAETIREDFTLYGAAARSVIEELLDTLQKPLGKTRPELLEALDEDMIYRAAHMVREN